MQLGFEHLRDQVAEAVRGGKTPLEWQVSYEGFRQLTAHRSPDPSDFYSDGQPLTLLGLPYGLGATSSGALVELVVRP